MEKFMCKWTIMAINWGFVGDLKLQDRSVFWEDLSKSISINVELPPIGENLTLIDYEVTLKAPADAPLVIRPVAMVIQLTREMRATTGATNLSVMLVFLVFGAVLFGLGRMIEGYAR